LVYYPTQIIHSTEFGLWLRDQTELDSRLGYVASNLDYIWRNYNTEDFMLIEEKRYNGKISYSQKQIFDLIHSICKKDFRYKGFHILKFEKTNPEDGKIFLNDLEISKKELIEFLKFNFEIDSEFKIKQINPKKKLKMFD